MAVGLCGEGKGESWDNLILSAKGNPDSPTVTYSQNPRHGKSTTVNRRNRYIRGFSHLFLNSPFFFSFSCSQLFIYYTLYILSSDILQAFCSVSSLFQIHSAVLRLPLLFFFYDHTHFVVIGWLMTTNTMDSPTLTTIIYIL